MSSHRHLTYSWWCLGFTMAAVVWGHWPYALVTGAVAVGFFEYWSRVEQPRYWRWLAETVAAREEEAVEAWRRRFERGK